MKEKEMTDEELGQAYIEYDEAYYNGNFEEVLRLNDVIYEENLRRLQETDNGILEQSYRRELKRCMENAHFIKRWMCENSHIDLTKPLDLFNI